MKRISLISTCSIGVILIITGLIILFNPMGIALLFYTYLGMFISNELMEIILLIATISLITGIIFLILSLFLGIRGIPRFVKEKLNEKEEKKEKRDYEDLTWLKHQYYDLGRTVQEIADEQNVSMITIRKWIDKLDKN